MVGLHTYVLAITLATVTGSALASPQKYRRELDNQIQSREVDRPRLGLALAPRMFVDKEDLFIRDLERDVFDLEAREPAPPVGAIRRVITAARGRTGSGGWKAAAKNVFTHAGNVGNAALTVGSAASVFSALRPQQGDPSTPGPVRRGLEENEDLFGRDFDAEELFEREYDVLDERDIIDNEDFFVRDLDGEEHFGREYEFLDERDIIQEDGEDFFVRDFDVEELFGREYDHLDERDNTMEDLD